MEADPDDLGETNQRIMIPAIIATLVLLAGGVAVALAPFLMFHSRSVYGYREYHAAGPIIGGLSLVPANVWALSVLWPRTVRKLLLVLVLVVLTAVAAGILFWVFSAIYLSTVDWFQF
ncbi:MAG: hypothetical protein M3N46_07145 [Actinomycetota bacterium]|nr:hypothetical protein [Actinomycetota bacterium]